MAKMKRDAHKLRGNKLLLADEWRKLRMARETLASDVARRETLKDSAARAAAAAALAPAGPRLKLSVGGQAFEVSCAILLREPGSLLAAIAGGPGKSPVSGNAEGVVHIDRDWWLFRLVLNFLRHGVAALPRKKAVLKQLHAEAEYFNLPVLRRAIQDKLVMDPIIPGASASAGSGGGTALLPYAGPAAGGYPLQPPVLPAGASPYYQQHHHLQYPQQQQYLQHMYDGYGSPYHSHPGDKRLDMSWWLGGVYRGRDFTDAGYGSSAAAPGAHLVPPAAFLGGAAPAAAAASSTAAWPASASYAFGMPPQLQAGLPPLATNSTWREDSLLYGPSVVPMPAHAYGDPMSASSMRFR